MNDKYKSITELNNYIKNILDSDFYLNRVYLKGEISNFKNHTRGHLYFTLKDETSRLNAVMFQGYTNNLVFKPEDGMNVLVKGRISAYPASGSYQIYVEEMELDGIGNLYIEFEKLKEKLFKEGLFNKEHKKPIPKFPNRIGVVTADTGAAVRDIMSTIKRRYPICEVILFPTLVQGEYAAPNIVKQIEVADNYGCDCLIVGRGGGSIEDLWAFNEEIVARAIYNAKTPIISAVGHEPDFTIADFVADLRAPTPTGAAEMAVPTIGDIINLLNQYKLRLNKNIKTLVNTKFIAWFNLKNAFVLKNPMSLYEMKEQKLDKLMDNLNVNMKTLMDNLFHTLEINLNNLKYVSPDKLIVNHQNKLGELVNKMNVNVDKLLVNYQYKLDYNINTLKLVNPLNILSNGYSLVKVGDKVIKSSKDLQENDLIDIKMHDGLVKAIVKEIE